MFVLQFISYFPLYILYIFHPYFVELVTPEALNIFNWYLKLYLLLGVPYFFVNGSLAPKEIAKFKSLKKSLFQIYTHRRIDETARVHLFKIVVKGFYAPLMLNFAFSHAYQVRKLLPFVFSSRPSFDTVNQLLLNTIFLIDTSIFAFGYLVETHWLKNSIKSVEPTLFGWVAALITYPPYNWISNIFLPFIKIDPLPLPSAVTIILQVVILLCYTLYAWATVALLFKASNLTNRGIVTAGPYRYLRHPAYIGKNIAWWLETLPYLNHPLNFVSLLGYNLIYYLRAITEERHLARDPSYGKYKKTTRF